MTHDGWYRVSHVKLGGFASYLSRIGPIHDRFMPVSGGPLLLKNAKKCQKNRWYPHPLALPVPVTEGQTRPFERPDVVA
jgi:hypothetical protein